VLHLVKFGKGCCQITSMTFEAIRGFNFTPNFLNCMKLDTLVTTTDFERLHDKAVLEAREVFQGILLF